MPNRALTSAASADDGQVSAAALDATLSGVGITTGLNLFARFPSAGIPQGVNITSATLYLTLVSDYDGTGNFGIALLNEDNSAQLSNHTDFAGRTKTSAVTGTFSSGVEDQELASFDIRVPVQTVVDRAGFTASSALQLYVAKNSGADLTVYLFDNGSKYPRLLITYQLGGIGSPAFSRLLVPRGL